MKTFAKDMKAHSEAGNQGVIRYSLHMEAQLQFLSLCGSPNRTAGPKPNRETKINTKLEI